MKCERWVRWDATVFYFPHNNAESGCLVKFTQKAVNKKTPEDFVHLHWILNKSLWGCDSQTLGDPILHNNHHKYHTETAAVGMQCIYNRLIWNCVNIALFKTQNIWEMKISQNPQSCGIMYGERRKTKLLWHCHHRLLLNVKY